MKRFDVLFVGNGILAVVSALEIKRRDPSLSIAIAGPSARPGAASKAAGAMLGCFGEITKYTMASNASRAKFEMCRASSRLWKDWLAALNEQSKTPNIAVTPGTVMIENAVSGYLDTDNYEAVLRALVDLEEPHEHVQPRDIKGLNPVPNARPLRAIYLPEEGAIESGATYDAVCDVLMGMGVTFVPTAVSKLLVVGNRATGAELLDGETLEAGKVVCAAGAYTTPILDSVLPPNEVQPVFAGTGIAMITHRETPVPFPHVVRSVNRAGSCGLHVVPMSEGRDYVGATNAIFATPRVRASAGLSHFLIQCAIDQLHQDFAHSGIVEWRVGNRPVSLDTFPLIGWTSIDGLYVAAGTYRDGFHNSPLIARIVADELAGKPPTHAHPFQPTRKPISTMSAIESIKECTYHAVCTGFEASLSIPRLWRHEMLSLIFAPGQLDFYNGLKTSHGLPPDLLPFLAAAALAPPGAELNAYQRVKALIAERGFSKDVQ